MAVTVAHAVEEAILRNTPPPSQLLQISGITELYVLGKMGSLGPLYHGLSPNGGSKISDQRRSDFIQIYNLYMIVNLCKPFTNKIQREIKCLMVHLRFFALC